MHELSAPATLMVFTSLDTLLFAFRSGKKLFSLKGTQLPRVWARPSIYNVDHPHGPRLSPIPQRAPSTKNDLANPATAPLL